MRDFRLGSTGQYPDGKLNETDDGEIQLAIYHNQGNVIVDFGTRIKWVGLPPQQAREFANLIIKHADKIEALGD